MKKLYFLDESEKERILNMHKYATKKQYLTESLNEDDVTTTMTTGRPSRTDRVISFGQSLWGGGKKKKKTYGGVTMNKATKNQLETYNQALDNTLKGYVNTEGNIMLSRPSQYVRPKKLDQLEEEIIELKENLTWYRKEFNNPYVLPNEKKEFAKLIKSTSADLAKKQSKKENLEETPSISYEYPGSDDFINIEKLKEIISKHIQKIDLDEDENEILKKLFSSKILDQTPGSFKHQDGKAVPSDPTKPIKTIDAGSNENLKSLLDKNSFKFDVKPRGIANYTFMRWIKKNPWRFSLIMSTIAIGSADIIYGFSVIGRWIGGYSSSSWDRLKASKTATDADAEVKKWCTHNQEKGRPWQPDQTIFEKFKIKYKDPNVFTTMFKTNLPKYTDICKCVAAGELNTNDYGNKSPLFQTVYSWGGYPYMNLLKDHILLKLSQAARVKEEDESIKRFLESEIDFEIYQYKSVKNGKITGKQAVKYALLNIGDKKNIIKLGEAIENPDLSVYILTKWNESGRVSGSYEDNTRLLYEGYDESGSITMYLGGKPLKGDALAIYEKLQKMVNATIFENELPKFKQDFITLTDQLKKILEL